MKQVHFCAKARIICESAQCVDGRVDGNAGNKAFAAVEDRDEQKAHCDGKDDLAQIVYKVHAAAVEQIDNVSDAEGHA